MNHKLLRTLFLIVILYTIQMAVCDILRISPSKNISFAKHATLTREEDNMTHKHFKDILLPIQDTYDSNYRHHKSDQKPQETIDLNIGNEYENDPSYLIDTAGCSIHSYDIPINDSNKKWNCGERLVEVKKVSDEIVEFSYEVPFLECCFSFVKVYRRKPVKTKCKKFTNKYLAQLKSEFIIVKCYPDDGYGEVYNDYYSFVKKKDLPYVQTSEKTFSVLLLGIDTMSRVRAHHSLNNTVQHLLKKGWFDMKGYQKPDSLTDNILIPLLTGMNHEQYLNAHCASNKQDCNKMLIWNYFADAGFVTATGEDTHYLDSVFSTPEGPWIRPTNHHITPLFKKSEPDEVHSVCSGHKQSGIELLDYILDFSKTYRHHPLFQFFWINSFSHDREHSPKPADLRLKDFFIKLEKFGALTDTIVILFSNHGFTKPLAVSTKFMKDPQDLLYDFSLPMLFIWLPRSFKKKIPIEYEAMKLNRKRISSVYDVYQTLKNILKLHDHSIHIPGAAGCATSKSLFNKISDHRTCDEACIIRQFCTCYNWDMLSNHHILPQSNHHFLIALKESSMNSTNSRKSILPYSNHHILPPSNHQSSQSHHHIIPQSHHYILPHSNHHIVRQSNHHIVPQLNHHILKLTNPNHQILQQYRVNWTGDHSGESVKQKSIGRLIVRQPGHRHVYTRTTRKMTRTLTRKMPRRRPFGSHTYREKKKMFEDFVKQKLLKPTTTTESVMLKRKINDIRYRKQLAAFSTPYWFDYR